VEYHLPFYFHSFGSIHQKMKKYLCHSWMPSCLAQTSFFKDDFFVMMIRLGEYCGVVVIVCLFRFELI